MPPVAKAADGPSPQVPSGFRDSLTEFGPGGEVVAGGVDGFEAGDGHSNVFEGFGVFVEEGEGGFGVGFGIELEGGDSHEADGGGTDVGRAAWCGGEGACGFIEAAFDVADSGKDIGDGAAEVAEGADA